MKNEQNKDNEISEDGNTIKGESNINSIYIQNVI